MIAVELAGRIDARDWPGLRALLANDCEITLLHRAVTIGPDQWVQFNAEYPGAWRFELEETVAEGDRVALRARTFDERAEYWVASFMNLDAGRVTRIVEVWADSMHNAPSTGPDLEGNHDQPAGTY
jgi:ketosteroid isomerase-like protein